MLRFAVCLTASALLACPAAGQVSGVGGSSRQASGFGSSTGGSGFGAGSAAGAGSLSAGGTGLGQAATSGRTGGSAAGGGAAGGSGLGGQTGTALGFGEGLQAQNPGTFLGSGAGQNTFVGGAGGQQALNAGGGTNGGFGGGNAGGFGGGAAGPTRSGGNRAAGSDPRLGIAVPLRIATPLPVRSPATLSQTLARRAAVLSAATRVATRPGFRNLRTTADEAGVVTLSGDLSEADRPLAAAMARIEPGVTAVREAYESDLESSPTLAPAPPAADSPLLISTDAVAPLRVLNP